MDGLSIRCKVLFEGRCRKPSTGKASSLQICNGFRERVSCEFQAVARSFGCADAVFVGHRPSPARLEQIFYRYVPGDVASQKRSVYIDLHRSQGLSPRLLISCGDSGQWVLPPHSPIAIADHCSVP